MESSNNEKNEKKNNQAKPAIDKRSAFYNYVKTKRAKLHAQFDPDKVDPGESTKIFKGVSCYFTGVSEYDELRELLVQNGGRFDHFLSRSNTTHIVSDQLAEAKKKSLKNALIVKSSWIYDCVKAGKILPTADYLLFKPLGIVDMFNSKSTSKTNHSSTGNHAENVTTDPSEDLVKHDAIDEGAAALASDHANGMDDEIADQFVNRLMESPSKHSMNDKNLNSASVSISNVRCTVNNTLHKYIGEASCQLHIRLRELFMKGKSLTLTVGVKKTSESNHVTVKPPRSDSKIKCPLDLTSRSTILPRPSNDVGLINSYVRGLMSTIKLQINHIKMIRIEMTNLEKCTEEEIAQWKSSAAAQSIPTFTTPLEEDKVEGIKGTPRKQDSPDPEIIEVSEPPAKKKLSLDVAEGRQTGKSPSKKSPAKKGKIKSSVKGAQAPVKSGPIDQFFFKKSTSTANKVNTGVETVAVNKKVHRNAGEAATSSSHSNEDESNRVQLSDLSKVLDPVPLLREWVITSHEPSNSFENFLVIEFLGKLVSTRNLFKLKCCTDALYE